MKRRKLKKGPKFILIGLIIAISIGLFMNNDIIHVESKAAILTDAKTKDFLYEKNATTAYPVASLSKIMTAYIVLENISAGEINWEDHVSMSASANDLMETAVRLPVETGTILTVEELFTAMIVASSNNAAIALAEHIARDEDLFTDIMNEKAVEIGLSANTVFVNATGLPNEARNNAENSMSAKDLAKLVTVLLEDYETSILQIANLQNYYIESQGLEVATTNMLLQKDGIDGLKTGYTNQAGYSFVGTAKQDGTRLITVVLNAEDEETRFDDTGRLLDYGFGEKSLPGVKGFFAKLKHDVRKVLQK